MTNFEKIRNDNRLLYEYIRGSHLYGLATEDSDVDSSGLFIAPHDTLLGIGLGYQELVADAKNDNTWYELRKYMHMLMKSNPSIIESLFVPEDKVITKPSPILAELFANKDKFITKQCFAPFVGYAVQQIGKARGLNKKIVNPMHERLTPFDFAYTFYKQGSTKIRNWLDNRGLDKDFCGLVHIPNMHDTYGVYYDWGAHFEKYGIKSYDDIPKNTKDFIEDFYELTGDGVSFVFEVLKNSWFDDNKEVKHYRGMCLDESTDMRGSSVSKGEKPLCWMVYNESGFKDHCKKYREYKEWEQNRNQKRYESNLDKNYDSKNMMHCIRLIRMGKEIANGDGLILDRRAAGDRDFLMAVRNHQFEYDELMEIVNKDKANLDEAIEKSSLPKKIDESFVNDLLIDIRKKAYHLS